jgi:hypothetical protein
VGSLGALTSPLVGFDISGSTGVAYAALNPPATTSTRLHTVNLSTGGVTPTGVVGHGAPLIGIAVHP